MLEIWGGGLKQGAGDKKGDSKTVKPVMVFLGRSLLNWRTKLRRYVAKKLREQAKALDIR